MSASVDCRSKTPMWKRYITWRSTCWWKGLDLSINVCEYEVNRLTIEQVIRGKRNFNANDVDRRTSRPNHPHGFQQSISRIFPQIIRLKKEIKTLK